jgi:hypothetical protein
MGVIRKYRNLMTYFPIFFRKINQNKFINKKYILYKYNNVYKNLIIKLNLISNKIIARGSNSKFKRNYKIKIALLNNLNKKYKRKIEKYLVKIFWEMINSNWIYYLDQNYQRL